MASANQGAAPAQHEDDGEVITATSDERAALREVERLLADTPEGTSPDSAEFTIVGPDGRKAPFTASLHRAVLQFVRLAQRRPVQISPRSRYLSTTQAAQVLGVSRPYLVKLIEAGKLPGEKVGTKRRVAIEDLMAYKRARAAGITGPRAALDRLVEMSGDTDIELAEIEDFYRNMRGRGQNQDGEHEHDAPGNVPLSAG